RSPPASLLPSPFFARDGRRRIPDSSRSQIPLAPSLPPPRTYRIYTPRPSIDSTLKPPPSSPPDAEIARRRTPSPAAPLPQQRPLPTPSTPPETTPALPIFIHISWFTHLSPKPTSATADDDHRSHHRVELAIVLIHPPPAPPRPPLDSTLNAMSPCALLRHQRPSEMPHASPSMPSPPFAAASL
uniref:Uncharacterized protein n=1 Tax=Aegilops tauschii subsp. strangulata TaxID=200361 RepID=A0A452Y7M4_AEGTS